MQEYHDGILLFDLTDKMVWSKAVTDTAGLEKFHEANRSKYMWKERVKVFTYSFLNEKAKKDGMKMAQAGKTPDEIKAKLNKKIAGTVVVTEQKAEKGEHAAMDKLWDQKGVVDIPNEGTSYRFYYVEGIVQPEPKTLKEAKGMVTSDYQNHLEKEWIAEMRSRYPVTVNEEVVKSLYQ
jgi:peptidyl-prolyl cis-trans isomerase SurA